MRRTALTAALIGTLAALTLSSASAQIFVETYDNGHNEGDYEIWFATYNSIPASGGNPDWYLRLDNTAGPLTCQFLEIFPNAWPNAFSGDYRAQGVTSVGLECRCIWLAMQGSCQQFANRLIPDHTLKLQDITAR